MPEISLAINSGELTFHTVNGRNPAELMGEILAAVQKRIVQAAKDQVLITEVKMHLLPPIGKLFKQDNLPDIVSGKSTEVIRIFNILGNFIDSPERRLAMAQAIADIP